MLWPCDRAPPGLGLSCPQPDPERPANWVRFSQLPGPGREVNDRTPSAPSGCASQLPSPGREVNDRTPSAPSARQAPRPARWPRPRPAALTRARELPIRRAWIVGCDWHTSSPRTPEKRRSYTACLLFGVKIALPACEQTSAGRAGCCNTGWPPTGREGVCGLSVARCLPSFVAERKNE